MKDSKSAQNRKILFVSHNMNLEGAPWSLFYLAKGFKQKGYQVSVIAPEEGPLMQAYEAEGMKVNIRNYSLGNSLTPEDLKQDIFFVNTTLGYEFIKQLDLKKHKVVWCIRESEKEKRTKNIPKETFHNVSRVIFVAEETRKLYEDLNNNNFVTIHNGIDIKKIDTHLKNNTKSELRKIYGFAQNDIIVNITGTKCLRKGQLEFAQSAISVINNLASYPLKFLMIGAGGDSPYGMRIQEIIEENNLEHKILSIDATPDIFDYYTLSDIFVCNSYIESFPRVILEAMAFSLPIIATNVYGNAEQIEDEKSGLLVSAGDVRGLASKIQYLVQNPRKAQSMAKGARQRLEKEFTYEKMLDKYIKTIQKVCAE